MAQLVEEVRTAAREERGCRSRHCRNTAVHPPYDHPLVDVEAGLRDLLHHRRRVARIDEVKLT